MKNFPKCLKRRFYMCSKIRVALIDYLSVGDEVRDEIGCVLKPIWPKYFNSRVLSLLLLYPTNMRIL